MTYQSVDEWLIAHKKELNEWHEDCIREALWSAATEAAEKKFSALQQVANERDAIALLKRWIVMWENGSGGMTIHDDTKMFFANVAQQTPVS